MKLDEQVCSLELAKRLKELGVRQESIFYYMNHLSNKDWSNCVRYPYGSDPRYWDFDNKISAFTVAELGEMLPEIVEIDDVHRRIQSYRAVQMGSGRDRWCIYYNYLYVKMPHVCEKDDTHFSSDNEADARAKMLIYLIEKGIVKP